MPPAPLELHQNMSNFVLQCINGSRLITSIKQYPFCVKQSLRQKWMTFLNSKDFQDTQQLVHSTYNNFSNTSPISLIQVSMQEAALFNNTLFPCMKWS